MKIKPEHDEYFKDGHRSQIILADKNNLTRTEQMLLKLNETHQVSHLGKLKIDNGDVLHVLVSNEKTFYVLDACSTVLIPPYSGVNKDKTLKALKKYLK